jgi:hypothetical protein
MLYPLRTVDADSLAGGFPGASAIVYAGDQLNHLGAPVGADDGRVDDALRGQVDMLRGGFSFDEWPGGIHHHLFGRGADL